MLLQAQQARLLIEREKLVGAVKEQEVQASELTLQKDVLRETVREKDELLTKQGKHLTFIQWQRTTLLGSTVVLLLVLLL